jgi:hypothetical protein
MREKPTNATIIHSVAFALAFVGFSRIFLLGILIFKGLTARRFYKSGVKGLIFPGQKAQIPDCSGQEETPLR